MKSGGIPTELDVLKVNQLISAQCMDSSGEVFYVNNSTTARLAGSIGGSNGNDGKSPLRPFETIDYAISRCVADRGDVIYVLPGHSETHAAANAGATGAITLDVEGVAIVGLGYGDARPKLLANFTVSTIDLIEVTADSCIIKNLIFQASTTAAPEARIDVADTDVVIESCTFYCGAFDTHTITLPAAGDRATIMDNKFFVTADGPDDAVIFEAAGNTQSKVLFNYFDGGDGTNKFDNAAIYSNFAHTNCDIGMNVFASCTGIVFAAAATGIIWWNIGGDPFTIGSCELVTGGAGGAGGGTINVVYPEAVVGSGGGGGEMTLGSTFYVDSTTGADTNDGSSPTTPFATLDAAISACTGDKGDMVVVMPAHAEDVAAQIDCDVNGIKIVGIGNGVNMPSFTTSNDLGAGNKVFRLDADDVEIMGLRFTALTHANPDGFIEVVTGADQPYIHDCVFDQGANSEQAIEFQGTSAAAVIKHNVFKVSANGPTEAIVATAGVLSDCIIEDNVFAGGSATNSWDNGAIVSDQVNTNILVKNNVISDLAATTHAIVLSSTTSNGLVTGNVIANNDEGYGIDTANVMVVNNYFSDPSRMALQAGVPQTTGKYIYCSSTVGGATQNGLSPSSAVSTLDAAVALCDPDCKNTIIVMPNHDEAPTATTGIDVDGVVIMGLGEGDNMPTWTPDGTAGAFSVFTVSANSVVIKGLRFAAESSGNNITDQIHINTGVNEVVIDGCRFTQGANDPDSIVFAGTSSFSTIKNCRWDVAADGPNYAIFSGAGSTPNLTIEGNVFQSGLSANSWDNAIIYSDQASTNVVVRNNVLGMLAATTDGILLSNTGASGIVEGNIIYGNDEGYGIDSATVVVGDNFIGDSSRLVLKEGVPQTTGKYIYVSSVVGTASQDGLSPASALAGLDAAVGLCDPNVHNTIIVMPGHNEILAAPVTADVAGMTIMGLGNGVNRPQFTVNDAIDGITVTASDVRITNIWFAESSAAATSHINVENVNAQVDNCWFFMGASDDYSITLTTPAAGCGIYDNKFRVTADGPLAAIHLEHVDCDITKIRRNLFDGGDATNSWDNGAIYSTVAPSEIVIGNNEFMYGKAATPLINFTSTADGIIHDNVFGFAVFNPIDPGSMTCQNNQWSNTDLDARSMPVPTYSAYDPVLGYKLSYTDGDVLDSVQNAIFTISGGRVLITALSMEITNAACSAGASTLQFIHDPTAAGTADYPLCAAGNDIAAAVVGSLFSITGDITANPTGGDPGSSAAMGMYRPIILAEGDIDIVTGADSGAGGALPLFEIWYKPLDAGATITAA